MRKTTATMIALAIVMMMVVSTGAAALATDANGNDTQPVERHFEPDGTPSDPAEPLGSSKLIRRDTGLKTTAHVEGLIPGGVYTFWWVVIQEGGFPTDAFVANGGGTVVGANGKATVRMNADLGQPSITGFKPDGINELPFAPLHDPMGATVRVEIAYHGQTDDAGDDLDLWLSDFWTGTACPDPGDVNAVGQPHCPVYIAAQHDAP